MKQRIIGIFCRLNEILVEQMFPTYIGSGRSAIHSEEHGKEPQGVNSPSAGCLNNLQI